MSYLLWGPIAVGTTFKAVTLTDFDYMKPHIQAYPQQKAYPGYVRSRFFPVSVFLCGVETRSHN